MAQQNTQVEQSVIDTENFVATVLTQQDTRQHDL